MTHTHDLSGSFHGMPGVTPVLEASYAESAIVCLNHNNLSPGTNLTVHYNESQFIVNVNWSTPTQQLLSAHKDLQDATEFGACSFAFFCIREFTEMTIVERSVKGTGFDYWIGKDDDDGFLFQKLARLEVSGILSNPREIHNRVKTKLSQVQRNSASELPSIIIVTEFSSLQTHMVSN